MTRSRTTGGPVDRPLRLAHRGDHRTADENTVGALRAAVAIPGVDGVEFDVRASADGEAILLHDPTLARVQGRPERASALASGELERLGVPAIDAALAAVPAAFLDIELKEDVAEQVVRAVRAARGDRPAGLVLSSFGPAVLERLGALVPDWPRWLNVVRLDEAAVATALSLGCRGVSASWRSIDERSIDAAVSAGLEVAGWTVTSARAADRLARLGVVALCVEGEALVSGAAR